MSDEGPPRLGDYEILESLGRGGMGMGVVYELLHDDPEFDRLYPSN